MNAEIPEELLSAYLDGELSDQQRELVDQRLKVSAQWRDTLVRLQASSQALKQLPPQELPRDLTPEVWREIAARQAAADNPLATSQGTTAAPIATTLPGSAPRGSRVAARRMRAKSRLQRYLAPILALGIAASLLAIAVPLGWFDGGPAPVAQHDPLTSDPTTDQPEDLPAEQLQADEPEASSPRRTSTFPTIEELAREQEAERMREGEVTEDEGEPRPRSPLRINIRGGRRPGAESPTGRSPVDRPASPEASPRAPQLGREVPRFGSAAGQSGFENGVPLQAMSEEVALRLLKAIGAEEDGTISDETIRRAAFRVPQLTASAEDTELLQALDVNDDGEITPAEIFGAIAMARATATPVGQQARAWFFRLDANEDGKWNTEDLADNVRNLGPEGVRVRRDLRARQEALDTLRDRQVNFVEAMFSADQLVEAMEPYEGRIFNPRIEAKAMRLFMEYDRSRSGRLGAMEIRRLIEAYPGDLEHLSQLPPGSVTPEVLYTALEEEALTAKMEE